MEPHPTFVFDELCSLAELPSRTVRYYIQQGLVDRPDGLNRGAKYTTRHLEQLIQIKKWQNAGLSLERIGELLRGDDTDLPPLKPKAPGTVEMWSRLQVARGLEFHVEAGEAGLSPESLRELYRGVLAVYQQLKNSSAN